jgi:hypothetical protein
MYCADLDSGNISITALQCVEVSLAPEPSMEIDVKVVSFLVWKGAAEMWTNAD